MFRNFLSTPLSFAAQQQAVVPAAPSKTLAQAAESIVSPQFLAAAAAEKGKDGPMGVIELYSPKYFVACGIGTFHVNRQKNRGDF